MDSTRLVLVTGAAGFVGRHVCERLERAGIPFLGIDQRIAPDGPELHACDITDNHALDNVFRQHPIATVIHLAAVLPSIARTDPALATRVNIDASLRLLELAAQSDVRRFVFASSMSVYGSFGSHHVFTEQDAIGPVDLYGTAKRYVELGGEIQANQGGTQFVALRIAGVVGAGSGSVTSAWRSEIFEKLGTGRSQSIVLLFASGSILSMLHVEDVADMLVTLAQAEKVPAPIYNTPAENWPIDELRQRIESLDPNVSVEIPTSGKPAPPLSDGGLFVRDLAYRLPSLADRLRQAAGFQAG